jgi:hypothetical protein
VGTLKITQLYDVVNSATEETLGKTDVLQADLTNIVDVGREIIDTDNVDNYVKKLVNHIGKVVFKNRLYSGGAPSVLMDSWEYGSILEKVSADLPEAQENESWQLEDGRDYSPDIFYQPSVSAKFFNSKVTFEIPLSFTEKQVKESFSNANQLNGFVSMLTTAVENSMTVKLDGLIMRTINNMIGETIAEDGGTGVRAVNLMRLYNDTVKPEDAVTVGNAFSNKEFIRHASYIIGLYSDRMSKISTLFNVGGKERFTSADYLHVVLLSDFEKASNVFLNSEIRNNEALKMPKYETVPYWQGSGTLYSFDDVSTVNVRTSTGDTVDISGVVGVMFDREALGVANLDRRVTTNYNPKAEFYTNFYKFDAGFYNDFNENFVVFYIGDEDATVTEPEPTA